MELSPEPPAPAPIITRATPPSPPLERTPWYHLPLLGFDAALARVTDKYKNALSELLAKALREVSLGRPRLEALDEMGRSSGVEDLHNFIQAVIQSEQFGTGIGKILRIQADEMRRRRRQRAQERGAQATLKMMLPMVGCIFPTLWIVLLGPAVLILMRPR